MGVDSQPPLNSLLLMLAIIGLVLIALWVMGLVLHIAGGFIHLVLIIALIAFVMHFLKGGKAAS